jgi:hypothetical protein
MNLAGKPAARPAHGLTPVAGHASGVLMHVYNGRVDHLDGGVMGTCQCIHDPQPDTLLDASERSGCSKWYTDQTPEAGRAMGHQIATQKMPLRTRPSFTRGIPRSLFGRNGLIADHSRSVSSWRMIEAPLWDCAIC